MKTFLKFLFLVCVTFLFVTPNFAQKDEGSVLQEMWGMEKKEIVREYMQFSPAEAEAFWPVYDAYMVERQKLGNDRLRIIEDYAKNYSTLTNQKAQDLTVAAMDNDLKISKLEKKYYKKFSKALTPLRASQFMQLDNYLYTTIRSEIQEAIPFIGELDQQRM